MTRPTVLLAAAAVALTLVVVAHAASRSRYVPAAASHQIVAYFGGTYLPGWLPRRYVYARWTVESGSGEAEYLRVFFGNHGRRVMWTVDDPADPHEYSHIDCSKHPVGRMARVNGKRVLYHGGAVGQTATICLGKSKAITVWNQYSVGRAALERIAASAIPVG